MLQTTIHVSSPAKINLFLHVTGQRQDGYHTLESLMLPISLCDQITLTIQPKPEGHSLTFSKSGDLNHLADDIDLTVRACQQFFHAASVSPHYHIHLHVTKHIPEQAGLGGGSSNAAHTLTALQNHFNQPLSTSHLQEIALSLGADVPFFLQSQAAFIEGIGEHLTPLNWPSLPLIIYKPPQNCPTHQIFRAKQLTRNKTTVKIAVFDLLQIINTELSNTGATTKIEKSTNLGARHLNFWQFLNQHTENSLQSVISELEPSWLSQFNVFKSLMQSKQPLLVRMSGSGSAMFAVFENNLLQQQAFKLTQHLPGQVFCCHTQ